MALCEVDGFVAGKGGELAGEDKGETEETVGGLWLWDSLGPGRAGPSGLGSLCGGPVELGRACLTLWHQINITVTVMLTVVLQQVASRLV